MFFEASGFRTVGYDSGEALLEVLRGETEIDTVIMDTDMYGMDGYEVCADFRKRHPNLFVIGCSGNPDYAQAWQDAGAELFLEKPFEYDLLLKSVKDRVC